MCENTWLKPFFLPLPCENHGFVPLFELGRAWTLLEPASSLFHNLTPHTETKKLFDVVRTHSCFKFNSPLKL